MRITEFISVVFVPKFNGGFLDVYLPFVYSGTMIPIPQYPIYSATCDLLGAHQVGYYLDESKGWDLNMKELEIALEESKANGINVNSFVLINPGNPTGQVLSKESIKVGSSFLFPWAK